MENLKCTTNNCEFHFKNHCTAGVLEIGDKGVCKSKRKRAGGAYAQAIAEFELADELTPLLERETEVQCNCETCKHNKDKTCLSKDLLIGDGVLTTKCFTKQNK